MREILFRGKRLTTNTWEYGSCVIDGEKALIFINEHTGTYVDPKTVGQYTGIDERDFNQKKIFGGDIVRCHVETVGYSHYEGHTGVVVMIEGRWWVDNENERKAMPLWKESGYHWEILGNTTDNPELLEDKK